MLREVVPKLSRVAVLGTSTSHPSSSAIRRLLGPTRSVTLSCSRIYALDCLALADACEVHAFAHITGGGLAANLSRVLPPGTGAALDRGTWYPPPVFGLLARHGGIADAEMERGLQPGHRDDRGGRAGRGRARARAAGRAGASQAWVAGQVTAGSGEAVLTGVHPGGD